MPDNTEARDIITTAQEAVAAEAIAPGVWLADNGRQVVNLYDQLAKRESRPSRKTGIYRFTDQAHLVAYLNKHKMPETEIYADVTKGTITAILNAHEGYLPDDEPADSNLYPGLPGWGDHRAILTLQVTDDWTRWTEHDGKLMRQVDFAEFVERQLPNFIDPSGASVLELAQEFRARKHVRFDSSHRVKSGQTQLTWHEDIEAKVGKGNIDVPDVITIGMKVFEHGEPVGLTARLRYRIDDGALGLGFLLDRPADVKRAVFDDVIATISEGTGVEVWHGVSA